MNRKQRRLPQPHAQVAQGAGKDTMLARDFREAVHHLQEGRLLQSEQAHRRVLARSPRHAPSLHNLGLIAFRSKARDEAIDYIRQSLAIDPRSQQAWLNLARILGEARRLDEAIDACRQCIALQPADARSHEVLGDLLRVARGNADAIAAYADSLRFKPDQPALLVKTGELCLQAGNRSEAMAHCRRALSQAPDFTDAQILERRILASGGDVDVAAAMVETRTGDAAERARLYDEMATSFRAQKRHAEAVMLERRAIACVPDRAQFHFNLAAALDGAGQSDDALAAYQAGLAIDPVNAQGYASAGSLLRKMGKHAAAIKLFEHATKLAPDLADAHYNLATTCKLVGLYEKADTAFVRAIECLPDSLTHHFELCDLRRIVCDWNGIDELDQHALGLLRTTSRGGVAPFLLISMPSDRSDQLEAARRFAAYKIAPAGEKFESYRPDPERRRIRVGYLSADFLSHATAMLLVEVLEKSDRDRFELFGYCYSPDDRSDMRRRVKDAFDRFVEIGSMTDREAAKLIHDDGIDILVDLKGYTRNARTEIMAYRPAPIQVNYLGYPGTMGADYIDYIVADAVVTPMEHQEHYSERIVHLPNCYQPNDRQRKIADETFTRAQFGLPEDAFVFCSFNNSYKLNAATFDVWMRLLANAPGSVLWILLGNDAGRDNLRREAAARGIDPARLVFADRMEIDLHLARHRLADLFLDTLPCNAHTTASDALWAGLPILTCIGETFSGRVAASLLAAMDLDELIAGSLEDYERMALAFALDRSTLAPIKRKIAVGREFGPLFDSTRYTHNLERAYETMVDIMRAGETPRAFTVVEDRPQAPSQEARIAYEHCPLCEGDDIPYQIEAKITAHPLYDPQLPPTVKWRGCQSCGHVFTEGYLAPEARDLVLLATLPHQQVGHDAENQRRISARIVERIARYVPNGEWLDVGVGNGSLLFTASEWGYATVGIDRRIDNIQTLLKLGFKALWSDIEDINWTDRVSVVSMAHGFPHSPFPKRTLAAAHRAMRPGGVLFLSMPNRDATVWRILDASGTNPYWGEVEHSHIFTRDSLVKLLEANGFKFAEYNVSERDPSAMEIIAIKS